jgi:hypothetical protein
LQVLILLFKHLHLALCSILLLLALLELALCGLDLLLDVCKEQVLIQRVYLADIRGASGVTAGLE